MEKLGFQLSLESCWHLEIPRSLEVSGKGSELQCSYVMSNSASTIEHHSSYFWFWTISTSSGLFSSLPWTSNSLQPQEVLGHQVVFRYVFLLFLSPAKTEHKISPEEMTSKLYACFLFGICCSSLQRLTISVSKTLGSEGISKPEYIGKTIAYQHPPRCGVWTLRGCLVASLTILLAPLGVSRYINIVLIWWSQVLLDILKWVFPKIMVPPNHPFVHRGFPL